MCSEIIAQIHARALSNILPQKIKPKISPVFPATKPYVLMLHTLVDQGTKLTRNPVVHSACAFKIPQEQHFQYLH